MRLSDLTDYAAKKYDIEARPVTRSGLKMKFIARQGAQVLVHPETGKWVALLFPNCEDSLDSEYCEIKCGQSVLRTVIAPFLCEPKQMNNNNWVGIRFDRTTCEDIVFNLFDKAMAADEAFGCKIVLGKDLPGQTSQYHETRLPQTRPALNRERTTQEPIRPKPDLVLDRRTHGLTGSSAYDRVMDAIEFMRECYKPGDGSFRQKCMNFYTQAFSLHPAELEMPFFPHCSEPKFHFPTYHDLTDSQVIVYLCWRTKIRKGEYRKTCPAYAYIYMYELLNMVGVDSEKEVVEALCKFETHYIDAGFGDEEMRKHLRRWVAEYAITHINNGLTEEEVRRYAPMGFEAKMKRDETLIVLHDPEKYSDEAVFQAFLDIGGKLLDSSPAFDKKYADAARHLFASAWRLAISHTRAMDKNVFETCFGKRYIYPWHPLGNAVYVEDSVEPFTFELNPVRHLTYDGVRYSEQGYETFNLNKLRIHAFLHETDRVVRGYLKSGRALQKNRDEEWVTPYAEEAVKRDMAEKEKANRPHIQIALGELDKIRADASETRDKLLTEEELGGGVLPVSEPQGTAEETENVDELPATAASLPPATAACLPEAGSAIIDSFHDDILRKLLHGEAVDGMIQAAFAMPEIVADEINEALFDEVGDNVVWCNGGSLELVEDYREEIAALLGEA